jgi:diguanylate cyclase (GGDEF)-like protein/PAS domain S-box-containing protein
MACRVISEAERPSRSLEPMPRPTRLFERDWRKYPAANLLIAVSCLALIGIAGSMTVRRIEFEREAAIANEMKKNSNLAIAIEEQTIRTFKAIDQALLFIRHQYREKGASLSIRKLIADGEIDDSSFTDVSIIDERGYRTIGLVEARPTSIAGRDYLQFHLQHREDALYIGKPELGRITGRWAIHVTRRIDKPDGSFGGIAIISLDPAYFVRLYQQADLGSQGLVALVGLDGIARARYAGKQGTFGDDLRRTVLLPERKRHAIGSFVGTGAIDGVVRYLSYRTLSDYPLIVLVGTSQSEALASFYKQERDYYFLVFALVSVLVAFFATAWIGALSRQRVALDTLSRTETQFRATYDQAAVGIVRTTLDGRFVQVNPALCRMLGYSEHELLARALRDVTWAEDLPTVEQDFQKRLSAGPSETSFPETETRCVCKDGSLLWVLTALTLARDGAGRPDYFVGVVQDITKRKELQDRLVYHASFDSLTHVPNRMSFYERLRQALSLARRKRRIASVLFIDLDRFKQVNDSIGHEAGDELLRQVAERIKAGIRLEDTTARLGGDEFAVILCELSHEQDAARVAQKIVAALARPFALRAGEVSVTASVGIGIFPTDSEDPDTLVKHADAAMLRAKARGRNNYQFYAEEMNERKLERIRMDAQLRSALEHDEFLLYFQPKLGLAGGEITGLEALLRWRHPEQGILLPEKFLPALEESGLIAAAGEWVVGSVCRQLGAWQQAGLLPVPVSINLSAGQLQRLDPRALVEGPLRAHGVAARLLELEVSESSVVREAAGTIATLRRLAESGVRVTIDCFGTGYSSLGWLQRFGLYSLKLDRALVRSLPADRTSSELAGAVIAMAHGIGLRVIGQGVETKEQLAFLAAHGCDEIQGFYFCRPLPAEECSRFVREHRAGAPVVASRVER